MNEFLRAVARVCGVHVSLLRDMVQCVSRRLLWCPCDVVFCGWGAALGAARETHRLPALSGSSQQVATPATYFRPPGRPCRKESQTFGLIPFRILWIASAVGCQSTHARLPGSSRRGQPVLETTRAPGARDHKGQPAPVSTKAVLKLDHLGTTSPTIIQISPFSKVKN